MDEFEEELQLCFMKQYPNGFNMRDFMNIWDYGNEFDKELEYIRDKRYCCGGCKQKKPFMFVVHDRIWKKYSEEHVVLCKKCFEIRLGRKLENKDLKKDAGTNKKWLK